ncbi:MAG TPA: polymer-forming cytoskeletal protein [Trueperaceae bacterium]|nr:polymer-forming cytoskeletal protein [Trueperaceae bacterium]
MLRRTPKKQEEPVKREPFTYIHRGTKLVGKVEAVGRVRVHGVVEGDVEVDGVVEVAPAGVIVGSLVRAEELRVLGKVEANVVVTGKVEIWNGGELIGDVKAAALDIEEGARFTGRSDMSGAPGAGRELPSGETEGTARDGEEQGRAVQTAGLDREGSAPEPEPAGTARWLERP